MHTTLRAKVRINKDTHDEVMFDIGVKQGCPLSPTLFGSCIDELEMCLDDINEDSQCSFNTMVAIFFSMSTMLVCSLIMIRLTKSYVQAI